MRRLRYIRNPKKLPHRLTERDIDILSIIDRFRYLTSQQIADLLTASRQAINKRLKLLFNHHYLEKLPAHLSPKLFNSPDVYFIDLDRKASRNLVKLGDALPLQKRAKAKKPKREYLQHTLLTNDILIAFELAARANPGIEFLPSHQLIGDLFKGEKRRGFSHPWKVSVFLPERGYSRTAYPDAAFALLDKSTGKKQLLLVEADRNTMPLTRKNNKLFRISNIKAKLVIYHTAWKQGVFRERFKTPATRILFVTLSEERARHMSELSAELFGGRAPGLFIFANKSELSTDSGFWSDVLGN